MSWSLLKKAIICPGKTALELWTINTLSPGRMNGFMLSPDTVISHDPKVAKESRNIFFWFGSMIIITLNPTFSR
jgi:hypothetical protein